MIIEEMEIYPQQSKCSWSRLISSLIDVAYFSPSVQQEEKGVIPWWHLSLTIPIGQILTARLSDELKSMGPMQGSRNALNQNQSAAYKGIQPQGKLTGYILDKFPLTVLSHYCLFPGCIVTWAWSLAKGQYMVAWLLTGAPRTKILPK